MPILKKSELCKKCGYAPPTALHHTKKRKGCHCCFCSYSDCKHEVCEHGICDTLEWEWNDTCECRYYYSQYAGGCFYCLIEKGKPYLKNMLNLDLCGALCVEAITIGRKDATHGKKKLGDDGLEKYGPSDEDRWFIDNIYECYKLGYQLGKFEYDQRQVKKD